MDELIDIFEGTRKQLECFFLDCLRNLVELATFAALTDIQSYKKHEKDFVFRNCSCDNDGMFPHCNVRDDGKRVRTTANKQGDAFWSYR